MQENAPGSGLQMSNGFSDWLARHQDPCGKTAYVTLFDRT